MRRLLTRTCPTLTAAGLALAGLTSALGGAAGCQPEEGAGPRTLVLALDGVPFRVVERARARGAFAGWPPTARLIAPFPSVTNVSFTEMLQPAGVGPAPGYEFAHFDREKNAKVNRSPFHYPERSFAWREEFDAIGRTLGSKLAVYTRPKKRARKELAKAREALFASSRDVVLAHVGSTDALEHLKGDDATLELLLELDGWLADLRARHEKQLGRALNVLLLSDHGNTEEKIEGARGFKRRLRKAGFHVSSRLEGERDVVATTFGIVSYGALFVAEGHAGRAAQAVADHRAVSFAVWESAPGELSLVSRDGRATIRWREVDGGRELAYEPLEGDPLGLAAALRAMADKRLMDGDGFVSDRDWLRETAAAEFPDAPYRLVESLTGDHLRNHASVLFSLRPGRSWGWKSAKAGSWLRGGHLEGTHGGLDRGSSVGFYLASVAGGLPLPVVRAGDALTGYLEQRARLVSCGGEERSVARRAAPRGPRSAQGAP